ncbi:MAG: type I-U CRISPR-associated protein Cas5/Cas6 [Actinobacteria bacterium]|nr:type I-U CRISPR-associated protein Cas5/Cas6 [Actinomycetota bacterium]
MLSIAVELLAGRYTATAFNDWAAPEWPPHPARLFSALVATWADEEIPAPDERSALSWLEAQSSPQLSCSADHQVARRTPVTVFVPVNDPTALTRDVHRSSYQAVLDAEAVLADANEARAAARAEKALAAARSKAINDAHKAGTASGIESASQIAGVLEILPEHRSKQGRWFPTVVPADPEVWFSWPEADPTDNQLVFLDRLCSRVGRLGHSSTFVSCRATAEAPPEPTLVPGVGDGMTLRVPRHGMIDRLEQDFAAHRGRVQGPLPSGSAVYGPPGTVKTVAPTPLLGGDWIVLSTPRPLVPGGPEALRLTRSLDLARAVRNALLSHSAQPVPEVLSGHQRGERPSAALQRPHLAVVALPNVGSRHSDGAVMGVALVLPAGASLDERRAVEDAITAWSATNGLTVVLGSSGKGPLRFQLVAARLDPASGADRDGPTVVTERRATLRRTTWCRPSAEWTTATPIALDRFPGDLGSPRAAVREGAEQEAKVTIRRACQFVGLPEPTEVEVDSASFLAAVPPANRKGRRGGFSAFTAGTSGQVRLGVHARLRFAEPVAGPMLIGAGRYLGYGLCLPLDRSTSQP